MPVNTRSGIAPLALKKLTSALACVMLLSVSAHAAGLGKLKVLSALGQPLKAEIELTALSSEEAGSLAVKLAPADAFRLANIEFNPALLSLRFAIEQRASRQIIAITSSQPLNEPFVDMLLELNWNSGRLVREYIFLLDPPDLRQNQPLQIAKPVAQATAPAGLQQQTQPVPAAAPRARPTPAESVVPRAPERASQSVAAPHRVKSGDTLTRIALSNKPADISLDQMLAALYRSNPGAFNGNNMNRLQAGKILAMPDEASMRAESKVEATGVVTVHAADFSAYRNTLAGQVALSAPAKKPEESQSVAGKISAKVEERATPANASKDQLKLSKAAPGATAEGKNAALEDQVAKAQQFADAQARVKELEKNVSDLESLIVAKVLQNAPAGPASATLPSLPAVAPVAPVAPKPPVVPVAPMVNTEAPAAPSLLDMVFDNILYLGLALAALLLALLALIVARRRPAKDAALTAGAPVAEDGGTGLDASNNSAFNSTFAASSSQFDTDEVDPVAEADVYIAYGREAQAEEILKEALRTHPERHPVRLKLLEIYAARKDVESFQAQASQLHGLSRGSADEWAQAALLGLSIDPLNPLYASAADVVAPAPAVDFDKSASVAAVTTATAALAAAAGLAVLEKKDQLPDATLAGPGAAAPEGLDLGERDEAAGLRLEPVAKPADTPTAAAPADPSFDIDFDLPFYAQPEPEPMIEPEFELQIEPAPTPAPIPTLIPVPAPAADAGLDFDFDLLPVAAPAVMPAHAGALDFMLSNPATPAVLDPVLDLDLGDANADALQETAATPDFDLSGITLDLNRATAELEPEPVAISADAAIEEEISVLAVEMDTKLDLAVAYQEIGDKEGARELIDEVINGGSKEQAAKARAMLAQLG